MEAQEYIKIERTRYLPSKIVVLVLRIGQLLRSWPQFSRLVALAASSCRDLFSLFPTTLLSLIAKVCNHGLTSCKSHLSRASTTHHHTAASNVPVRRRCRGDHGHRLCAGPSPVPHLAAAVLVVPAVVIVLLFLPQQRVLLPRRRNGEEARRGDGARAGEEERAGREHQRRRARLHRVLPRQGAARRRARRDGAHRRGRGVRQDEEAALLALLGIPSPSQHTRCRSIV
jgi:hypothetical protein